MILIESTTVMLRSVPSNRKPLIHESWILIHLSENSRLFFNE